MTADASIARVSASWTNVRTRPDTHRLLETTNALCRLLDKQREVSARMARFRPRLLHQRVADHDGASEFAGKRLEAARRIHRGADHGKFQPVEADISQHDLAIMQSDADLDRRLVAAASLTVQLGDRADHAPRATQGVHRIRIAGEGRTERRHQTIAEILVERSAVPEHFSFHP